MTGGLVAAVEGNENAAGCTGTKMTFILLGFSQDTKFRIFVFEGIGSDRTRTAFAVRADVAMTRSYGISLQDLPLLCRGVLERRDDGDEKRAFTYTEADMRLLADDRTAARVAAAQKKQRQPHTSPARTSELPGESHGGTTVRPLWICGRQAASVFPRTVVAQPLSYPPRD
jgi:hypothetical protein